MSLPRLGSGADTRPAVYFRGAIQRALRQRSLRAKLRALSLIGTFVIEEVASLAFTGIPMLPAIGAALRNRSRVDVGNGASLDLYAPEDDDGTSPIVLYVHGGAWGSGDSWNFAPIGTALSQKYAQCFVYILDYAKYPEALMEDQVDSVIRALRYLRASHKQRRVVCLAQSSGAHISAMAFLTCRPEAAQKPLADVFIAQAGVYNIGAHFMYESSRCLAYVSPMLPATGAPVRGSYTSRMDAQSPLLLLQGMSLRNEALCCNAPELEGFACSQYMRSMIHRSAKPDPLPADAIVFPETFVQAAVADLTVPTTANSIPFYEALVAGGSTGGGLLLYEGQLGHADFVLDWASSEHIVRREARSLFLDVDTNDDHLRARVARHVYGDFVTSPEDGAKDAALGPAAHIRDVTRILRKCSS